MARALGQLLVRRGHLDYHPELVGDGSASRGSSATHDAVAAVDVEAETGRSRRRSTPGSAGAPPRAFVDARYHGRAADARDADGAISPSDARLPA